MLRFILGCNWVKQENLFMWSFIIHLLIISLVSVVIWILNMIIIKIFTDISNCINNHWNTIWNLKKVRGNTNNPRVNFVLFEDWIFLPRRKMCDIADHSYYTYWCLATAWALLSYSEDTNTRKTKAGSHREELSLAARVILNSNREQRIR